MRSAILVSFVLVCLTAAASPGFARDTVEFRFHASDLATDDSVAALHQRLTARAERLCKTRDSDDFRPGVVEACAAALADQWVREIDDPHLSALHASL